MSEILNEVNNSEELSREIAEETSAEKVQKKKKMNPKVAKIIKTIVMCLLAVVISGLSLASAAVGGILTLNSGAVMSEQMEVTETRSFLTDLSAIVYNQKSDILNEIYSIPKVYILPWSEDPAPVPNPDGYTYKKGSDIPVSYEDETIKVEYWTERIFDSNVHLAKITIAHPTQLRTALAGGTYGNDRYTPRTIARGVNAVIATNADYYNYRKTGVLVRQGVLYRNKPHEWDMLLIDDEGNFHILYDEDEEVQRLIESGKIVNTLHFGPSLVIDGEINIMHTFSGCGHKWNAKDSPRTAIGQIGELTYLMCCVEGRMSDSNGVKTREMAQIMKDHGCQQAYLLDGGQSTTMVFNGIAVNRPLWGGMRPVSDVVYFATAIDEQ